MHGLVATTMIVPVVAFGLSSVAASGLESAAEADGMPAITVSLPVSAELSQATRLLMEGRFEEVEPLMSAYVQAHPKSSQAEFLLALSYHKRRQYEKAKPHFERALDRPPTNPLVHHFFGYCLYYLGERESARAEFLAYLALNPNEADAHFGLGLIELDADRREQAKQRFERAIALQKGRPDRRIESASAHARMSDVLVREHRLEEARDHLERAVAMNPDLYVAYYKLYRVLLRLGETDAAAEAKRRHEEVQQRVRPSTGFPE